MEICSFNSYGDLSSAAADRICQIIEKNPKAVFVLPTGNTPLGMFETLIQRFKSGLVSFNEAYLFELDEYLHQPKQDGPVLFAWLEKVFLNKVDFQQEKVFFFDPKTKNTKNECNKIQTRMDALGGADLVILGLGPNGHLAMNEPRTSFNASTRLVDLTPATIKSNSVYWGDESMVPLQGMTIGMNTFLDAREVILLVNGSSKKDILQRIISTPTNTELPATILHSLPNAYIYADKKALGNE